MLYKPAGFETKSSILRRRSISSSYSPTAFLKPLNISSAAALSASLTNPLKFSNEVIVAFYSQPLQVWDIVEQLHFCVYIRRMSHCGVPTGEERQ